MPELTEKVHLHYWLLDSANHAVCKSCPAEKDFPRIPWYSPKIEQRNRKLFINPAHVRQELKGVREL